MPRTKAASHGRPATPGPADDVVDLLLAQHARIEEQFLLVTGGTGEARRDAFDDLVRLLAVHETAEEEIIHPRHPAKAEWHRKGCPNIKP